MVLASALLTVICDIWVATRAFGAPILSAVLSVETVPVGG